MISLRHFLIVVCPSLGLRDSFKFSNEPPRDKVFSRKNNFLFVKTFSRWEKLSSEAYIQYAYRHIWLLRFMDKRIDWHNVHRYLIVTLYTALNRLKKRSKDHYSDCVNAYILEGLRIYNETNGWETRIILVRMISFSWLNNFESNWINLHFIAIHFYSQLSEIRWKNSKMGKYSQNETQIIEIISKCFHQWKKNIWAIYICGLWTGFLI